MKFRDLCYYELMSREEKDSFTPSVILIEFIDPSHTFSGKWCSHKTNCKKTHRRKNLFSVTNMPYSVKLVAIM